MMKRTIALAALVALSAASFAAAQEQQVSEPTGKKTLAATVGLYVFPAEGQATEQQSKDEAFCYNWAVDNTQSDPFSLARRAQQSEQAAAQKQAHIDQAEVLGQNRQIQDIDDAVQIQVSRTVR